MDHWDFIERAAAELGVGPEAVRKWRNPNRGVSHQWRLPIIEIAQREGFPLDRAEFDKPPGPKRVRLSEAAQ